LHPPQWSAIELGHNNYLTSELSIFSIHVSFSYAAIYMNEYSAGGHYSKQLSP